VLADGYAQSPIVIAALDLFGLPLGELLRNFNGKMLTRLGVLMSSSLQHKLAENGR